MAVGAQRQPYLLLAVALVLLEQQAGLVAVPLVAELPVAAVVDDAVEPFVPVQLAVPLGT